MICEMALILAIDVSGSVLDHHYELQRDATAAAIQERIQPNAHAPIAIQVIMWGTTHHVVVPWSLLTTHSRINQVAQQLSQTERPERGLTHMTNLMQFALDSYAHVPCEAERMILDISGDGDDTERSVHVQRDRAQLMQVQVNGLPIVTEIQTIDISEYFRSQVVTWDGFVITADSWHAFHRAIRGKLVLEIAGNAAP
jgi:hypothetical protein